MNGLFKPAGQNTTAASTYLFKLSQPLPKTNHGQKSISYVAPCNCEQIARFLKSKREHQHIQTQS